MKRIFSLLLFLSLASLSLSTTTTIKAVRSDEDNQCVYTLYIKTGLSVMKTTSAWTHSTSKPVISVAFAGRDGSEVQFTDLVSWGGLMGPDHDYFQWGNLDIFSGRGPCLSDPPCRMNLTSDASGPRPGWYCEYVKLTTTEPHVMCAQLKFEVEQWLGTDLPPYQPYAVRNYCPQPEPGSGLVEIMSREGRAMRAGA